MDNAPRSVGLITTKSAKDTKVSHDYNSELRALLCIIVQSFRGSRKFSSDHPDDLGPEKIYRGDTEYAEKRILSSKTPNSATSVTSAVKSFLCSVCLAALPRWSSVVNTFLLTSLGFATLDPLE